MVTKYAKPTLWRRSIMDKKIVRMESVLDWERMHLIERTRYALAESPEQWLGTKFCSDRRVVSSLLQRAERFELDAQTSSLLVDFSYAILKDLEGARALACPPYPVTWFGVDNHARINRVKAMRIQGLTTSAASDDHVPYVGWLVDTHPQQPTAHRLTYVTEINQGPVIAPLSFAWDQQGLPSPWSDAKPENEYGMRMLNQKIFGVHLEEPVAGCYLTILPGGSEMVSSEWVGLMDEIVGEMRYLFGLLVAMSVCDVKTTISDRSDVPVKFPSGKPIITGQSRKVIIHLGRKDPARVFLRAAGAARKAWHMVRGHWRTYRNEDGTTRKRSFIEAHARGDERLGRIDKTYEVRR